MIFSQRHIFFSLLVLALLVSVATGALGYTLSVLGYPRDIELLAEISAALILFSIVLLFGVQIPLNKVVHQMQALLLGKSYSRVSITRKDEIGFLAHFFNEITKNLERFSSSIISSERRQKELNAAQKIQQDLLPHNKVSAPGLEIAADTKPASEIGGDAFDFFEKDGRILFYIGDSTGHGMPAGIVMVMMDVLLSTFVNMENSLSSMLVQTNRYLKPHLQTTMFMTLILLEWLPKERIVRWAGAGHEHLIHFDSKTGQAKATPAGGIAMGMLPDISKQVKEQTLDLPLNDFLILYSDGIVNAKNVMGEIYGLERFLKLIQNHANSGVTTKELYERIASEVSHYMDGTAQDDDMTLMVLKSVA